MNNEKQEEVTDTNQPILEKHSAPRKSDDTYSEIEQPLKDLDQNSSNNSGIEVLPGVKILEK